MGDEPLVPRTGWTLEDEYRALSAEFIQVEENRDRLAEQLRGAVERIDAALRMIEDHRDSRGNVQMGRGFSSQVIELLSKARA